MDPPVYISKSRGFEASVEFKVDTSKVTDKDDYNGDGKYTQDDVAMALDEIVSTPIVLAVAGCQEEAVGMATAYYDANKNYTRKLEESSSSPTTNLTVLENWDCSKYFGL
jgi:hypothetical protein